MLNLLMDTTNKQSLGYHAVWPDTKMSDRSDLQLIARCLLMFNIRTGAEHSKVNG
jgi:hypothetical protein